MFWTEVASALEGLTHGQSRCCWFFELKAFQGVNASIVIADAILFKLRTLLSGKHQAW